MNIILNSSRQNETDTTVFFTLTDGDDTFKWHCDIQQINMTNAEIQTVLEVNVETYRCGIYRKLYFDAQITKEVGEIELNAWQRWITAGCKNISGNVITITIWKDTH
jgi:hypothetical protein